MADDTPQVDLIVKRLEKLGKQNPRFKQVGLGVALALSSLLLMGQTRPQLQDMIVLGRARLSRHAARGCHRRTFGRLSGAK
jgi:hypothetical protein